MLAFVVAAALPACSLPRAATTNLAAQLENNLVVVDAVVGGVAGRFLVGSAQPVTVLDHSFGGKTSGRDRLLIQLGTSHSIRIDPVRADLEGIADGILGADAWRDRSLTIDYARGLVILGRDLDPIGEGLRHSFDLVPLVPVLIDGVEFPAVVDATNPDTILLPQSDFGEPGRRRIDLQVGVTRFSGIDARVAPVGEVRLGNRILSRFLVTIDYERREVSLWPRRR